jgi:hypothetical protein
VPSTLTNEAHRVFRLSEFGGGWGSAGVLRTHEFTLMPPRNGFFSVHASLSRAGGGGEAAIGLTEFVDQNGQTVIAPNEAEWVPLALTESGVFTAAALARGAAMTGSIRIQAWEFV